MIFGLFVCLFGWLVDWFVWLVGYFFETKSCYIVQAYLEHPEILLPLPLICWVGF